MKENSRIRMKMSIANELVTTSGSTSTIAAEREPAKSSCAIGSMPGIIALSRRQGRSA